MSTPGKSPSQNTEHEDGELSEDGEIEDDDPEDHEDGYSYEDEVEDNAAPAGYYADGVYYAAPPIGPGRPPPEYMADNANGDSEPKMLDAQDAFHTAMLDRFRKHRSFLRQKAFEDSARPDTIINLLRYDPRLRYISVLEYDEIFKLLGAATRHLYRGEKGGFSVLQCRRLGAWMWSLLAKVEELGTLSSEEVGQVRELGKGAVEVIRKRLMKEEDVSVVEDEDDLADLDATDDALDAPDQEMADSENEEDSAEEDEDDGGALLKQSVNRLDNQDPAEQRGDDWCPDCQRAFSTKIKFNDHLIGQQHLNAIAARKAQPLKFGEKASAPSLEALATDFDASAAEDDASERGKQVDAMLDMVLTIVGEEFGQKDLLAARDAIWHPPQLA